MENIKDLVIIGSGPAGLSAAVYASRAMIDQVVIETAKNSILVAAGKMSAKQMGDELGFNSIREYNAFLAKNGLYKKGAPTI